LSVTMCIKEMAMADRAITLRAELSSLDACGG
jgi:hypothetical protein